MNENREDIKINHKIIDFLAGEANESEQIHIREWIDASDANKAYFIKVKEMWSNNLSKEDSSAFQTDAGWNKFVNKYPFNSPKVELSSSITKSKKILYNVFKVAAVLIIGLVLWQSGLFDPKEITCSTDHVKKKLDLPDQSTIYMNNNSQISYRSNLNRKRTREVHFSGEAFFDISPDPNRPFIIFTNHVKIVVKGTSFNVRSYPGEPVEVTVKTGIVEVTEISEKQQVKPVTLKKDEKIKIDTKTNNLDVFENDNPNYLAWKTESYVFDSISISLVMESLQKGYDTTIVIENPEFNNCYLIAKFDSLSLGQIFWILQRTYDISVSINHDTIFVEGKGCN